MSTPYRKAMRDQDEDSPDPLGYSGDVNTLPPSPIKRTPSRPLGSIDLKPTILRGLSPQKTLIIDPEVDSGVSPYRIRVTVQAEPREDIASPSPTRKRSRSPKKQKEPVVKTISIPLRDADEDDNDNITIKRGGKRRRSGTPAPKRRKATPRKSLTDKEREAILADEWDPTRPVSLSQPLPTQSRRSLSPRKRGRPRKLSSFADEDGLSDSSPQDEQVNQSPTNTSRSRTTVSRQKSSSVPISEVDIAIDGEKNEPEPPVDLLSPMPSASIAAEHLIQPSPHNVAATALPALDSEFSEVSATFSPGYSTHQLVLPSPPQVESIILSSPKVLPQNTTAEMPSPAKRPTRFSSLPARDPIPPSEPLTDQLDLLDDDDDDDDEGEPVFGDTGPISDESDMEAEVDMINAVPTMGDETMMKSMDMTIVSPSALYSKLDVQSSLLHVTPAHTRLSQNAASSRSNQSIQEQVISTKITQFAQADASLHSSPHVTFSSPLVTGQRNSSPPAASSPSSRKSFTELKSSRLSPAPERSILRSRSPAQQLPTPESDERPENDEEDDSSFEEDPNPAATKETTQPETTQQNPIHDPWQADRDLVITQARQAPASRVVEIQEEDYSEEDDEMSEEEDHMRAEHDVRQDSQTVGPMKDPQSEADFDIWQEAGEQTSQSVLENSRVSNRSTVASYRAANKLKSTLEQPAAIPPIPTGRPVLPRPQQRKISANRKSMNRRQTFEKNDEIAALFRTFGHVDRPIPSVEVDHEPTDVTEEDIASSEHNVGNLSAMLRQKVTNLMDDSSFSFVNMNPFRVKKENKPAPAHQPELQRPQRPDLRLLSPPVILPHSPRRSSPLKHRLESEEDESSVINTNVTMLSDVRQLKNDMRAAKRPALEHNIVQASPKRRPRKTLLKMTQVRQAKAAMRNSPEKSPIESTFNNSSLFGSTSFVSNDSTETNENTDESNAQKVAKRVFSFVPTRPQQPQPEPSIQSISINPLPPRKPTHRLLKNFRMLPRQHPWTDNHFRAILSLYSHWLTHEDQYLPSRPENAYLLTPRWRQYINMEFFNWGYRLKVSESLVVVAALCEQLLVLEHEHEYKDLYGESMQKGFVAAQTEEQGIITEWHIVLRLFTTVVGDVLRGDEQKGREIDRTPALKWKFANQWFWRRGWWL